MVLTFKIVGATFLRHKSLPKGSVGPAQPIICIAKQNTKTRWYGLIPSARNMQQTPQVITLGRNSSFNELFKVFA
jgi:hypothetical protein